MKEKAQLEQKTIKILLNVEKNKIIKVLNPKTLAFQFSGSFIMNQLSVDTINKW
uniref:Uncharacterized protein n=1 Tax=Rhizophagus irregularis (strain DAOM 181602 / DAOM 197198 / MUCL 43194) TaxID=747089 RepID=U9U3N4_RHIID